jgi:hypothetical protein
MAKKVNVNFKGLLSDMKKQPKDAKGRFKDRDFAKYVSRKLSEVRKFAKPFKKGSKQLKLNLKTSKRK